MRTPPMRTAVLAVGLAILLAGCIGGPPSGTVTPITSESPTSTPSPTDGTPEPRSPVASPGTTTASDGTADAPTTVTTPCSEDRVTTVDPVRESVTPSPLPERPDTLTAETVESYVESYERAFRRNVGFEENTQTFGVSIHDVSVSERDGGFVVNVTGRYWYNAGGPAEGTETATIVHADGPSYEVTYSLTEGSMQRTGGEYDGVDEEGWIVVECWS